MDNEFQELVCSFCHKFIGYIRYGTQEEVLCPRCIKGYEVDDD